MRIAYTNNIEQNTANTSILHFSLIYINYFKPYTRRFTKMK